MPSVALKRCAQKTARLVDAAENGDAGVAEDVCDLCFTEARSVVFEREMELGVVNGETAEAVGVGKFSERAKLRVRERRLQFKFCFKECHVEIIAGPLEVLKRDATKKIRAGACSFNFLVERSKRGLSALQPGVQTPHARKSRATPVEMTAARFCGLARAQNGEPH